MEARGAQIETTSVQSDLRKLSDAFITLFQAVKKELERLPDGLAIVKRTLATLVLPLKFGGVVQLIPSTLFSGAKCVDEILINLSPLMNPLSFNLLGSLSILSHCTSASESVSQFCRLRDAKGYLVLCSDQWVPPTAADGLNDLDSLATSGAESAHAASFDHLRSFHPQLFAKPQECENLTSVIDFVRVSVQLNRKVVSLSDFDEIVTAISGFFLLPKCALVYVGCSNRPLTLCWCVTREMSNYMKQVPVHNMSSELLLSEQGIAHVMIGDWLDYKCLTSKVRNYIIIVIY